jgi:hypothetical protein
VVSFCSWGWFFNYRFWQLPDFGNLFAPLSLRLSARTPPGILVLLQINIKPQFDRAVTARSKVIFRYFRPRFAYLNDGCNFGFPKCQAEGRKPHPGVGTFVVNKSQSAIRQPYDSLVEAIFPCALALDLVWLLTANY